MTDQRDETAKDDPARDPADGPVITVRELPPREEAAAEAEAHPAIESSLVGDGGPLPAAERRSSDDASEAGRDAPAEPEMDEPSPEPTSGDDGVTARKMPWPAAEQPANGDTLPPTTWDAEAERTTDWQADDTIPAATATAERPPLDTAPITAAAAPAPRRGGFWPAILGGVIAAGLGAGAMYYVLDTRPAAPASLSAEAEAAVRTAATEAAKAEVDGRAQALSDAARQAGTAAGTDAAKAALAAAPVPAADTTALDQQATRIQSLEARLTALADRPAAAAPAAPATPGATAAPGDLGSLRADLDAQAARIAELAARPAFDAAAVTEVQRLAADIQTQRQAIETRLTEAGAQADAIAGRVEETTRLVSNTAALAALETALANGSDGSAAATQLQAAGVAPPEALTKPIPALADLQRDFPEAARAGLRAALEADRTGTGGGFGNFLRVQTGARSVEPRAGTDPDAILSRAGAAVQAGDIATALTEVGSLPAPAQSAMAGWTGPAAAWAAGQQAVDALKAKP